MITVIIIENNGQLYQINIIDTSVFISNEILDETNKAVTAFRIWMGDY